ncbi:S26 family signal peptidase [Actinoplanes sp. NPDC048967]|uniref:S26 family signal peptidase n=1 Tax=Actinoplanes sp. NPDC048967 TaxID=3155269 RepID=UPI0033D126E2
MTAASAAGGVLAAGLLIAVLVGWLRRGRVVVVVDGDSMAPTLRRGDRVLVRRGAAVRPRTGDVVLIEKPAGGMMIKRVAAVGGEAVPEQCVPPSASSGTPVPAGMLLVVGDNRADSWDSRTFGYLRADLIVGVALRPLRAPVRPRAPGRRPGAGRASRTGRPGLR